LLYAGDWISVLEWGAWGEIEKLLHVAFKIFCLDRNAVERSSVDTKCLF
jgi:hypothetical protein